MILIALWHTGMTLFHTPLSEPSPVIHLYLNKPRLSPREAKQLLQQIANNVFQVRITTLWMCSQVHNALELPLATLSLNYS